MTKKLSLFFIAVFFALDAFAFPVATRPRPDFMPFTALSGYDFEGIVALSNCSGSLVQFAGQPDDSPAYVMTNGHCVEGGFLRPGQILYGKQTSRRFTLLNPNSSDAGRVNATTIVYATMTKTDLALYRLRETYTQIYNNFRIRPLVLANERPVIQQPIEIISGYWRRGYSCNIDQFIYRLREGDWESHDSIRYSNPGCDVIGGTSGSPIIARGSRVAIGVNNTGNENGGRCTMNNPCEIDEKGNIHYEKDLNYGQQTYWSYSCLNANYEIDLNQDGCELYH